MGAQTGRVFRLFGLNNNVAITTATSTARASLCTVVDSSECSRCMALPPTKNSIAVFTRDARK